MQDTLHILLVEDSDGDAQLVREALRETSFVSRLHHVSTGAEALAFLRRRAPYDLAPRPSLVLLDLNLPGMDGYAVLRAIRDDDALHKLPVIILSSSDDPVDMEESYALSANCYIKKPADFAQFIEIAKDIEGFWLKAVVLAR